MSRYSDLFETLKNYNIDRAAKGEFVSVYSKIEVVAILRNGL